MRCARCGKPLYQDADGWYSQVTVTDDEVPGLAFADRVHECDGKPHDVVSESLDVNPRPMEVAAAWLPAGCRVSLRGRDIPNPDLENPRYVVAGWHEVSGGALICVYGGWQGIRNGQRKDSRPVWDEAATFLRQAARQDKGPVAVYVAIESREKYGRAYLVAVRVRSAAR